MVKIEVCGDILETRIVKEFRRFTGLKKWGHYTRGRDDA